MLIGHLLCANWECMLNKMVIVSAAVGLNVPWGRKTNRQWEYNVQRVLTGEDPSPHSPDSWATHRT